MRSKALAGFRYFRNSKVVKNKAKPVDRASIWPSHPLPPGWEVSMRMNRRKYPDPTCLGGGGSGQLAVGSWQYAVGSWRYSVGSMQLAVLSYQLAVRSWQLAVLSWQLAVRSWRYLVSVHTIWCLS